MFFFQMDIERRRFIWLVILPALLSYSARIMGLIRPYFLVEYVGWGRLTSHSVIKGASQHEETGSAIGLVFLHGKISMACGCLVGGFL